MFFLNSASSAAALVFYLFGVCTHTDTEGKQREARVRNILKSSEKTQYLMNTLYILYYYKFCNNLKWKWKSKETFYDSFLRLFSWKQFSVKLKMEKWLKDKKYFIINVFENITGLTPGLTGLLPEGWFLHNGHTHGRTTVGLLSCAGLARHHCGQIPFNYLRMLWHTENLPGTNVVFRCTRFAPGRSWALNSKQNPVEGKTRYSDVKYPPDIGYCAQPYIGDIK